ncbi:MAG TPA: dienelactone hydrolase family protein [Candidatus Dormibacteraeota bacterium]|nr:dienelactone hydrolase family protein [Candidatus Dormibacteraeota bacterium]
MIEKEVEIWTEDGTADAVLYRPEGSGKFPGVMHLPDIGGIRDSHKGMARRLAEQGYVVLLVNVFYRSGKTPVWAFPFKMGEDRSMKRMGELAGALPPEAMERDAIAYVDFLSKQEGVSGAPIGVVGYCFTGGMAMRTAAARPDKIGAAASFHGGHLYTDAPTSPHTVLPKVKARLYFGHADGDPFMPQDAIDNLGKALAAWGGKYQSEVYPGAKHSWTVPDSPVYDQAQADRAFGKLTELFQAALK